MKYLLLILSTLFVLNLNAQVDLKTVQDEVWSQGEFSDKIPEKWKNESAVIVYQRFFNKYYKIALSGKLEHTHITRRRIKLLDQAAVNQYSIFEYEPNEIRKKKVNHVVAVKVIKPSGKETIIDTSFAENVYVGDELVGKKLAVPDLTPGDIIDFLEVEREVLKNVGGYHEFPIEYHTLTWPNPVLKQEIEFQALRKCRIAVKSLNGAPEFQEKQIDEDLVSYILTDKERDKNEERIWIDKLRSLPSIKFKVIFTSSELNIQSKNFFESKSSVMKSVSKEEILRFMNVPIPEYYPSWIGGSVYNPVLAEVNKNEEIKGKKEKLKAYHQLALFKKATNDMYVRLKYSKLYKSEPSIHNKVVNLLPSMYYCKKEKIPCSLVVVPIKQVSDIKDVISQEELIPLLRAEIGGESVYLFHDYSTVASGEIPYYIQGANAYAIKLASESSKRKLYEHQIPYTNSHKRVSEIELRANVEKNKLELVNDEKLTGYFKYRKCAQLQYYIPEMNYPFLGKVERTNVPDYGEYKVSQQSVAEGRFGKNLVDYDFDLTQVGISFQNDTMLFYETFAVENQLRTLGKDKYLLQLASVLGSQIHIPKYLREKRTLDIRMDAPKVYETKLRILKPENFELSQAGDLEGKFENEIGVFETKVQTEGEYLLIHIIETYKADTFTSSMWPKAVEFTDYVYDYYKQGVVLKKL